VEDDRIEDMTLNDPLPGMVSVASCTFLYFSARLTHNGGEEDG
jgi:hypothetical protein